MGYCVADDEQCRAGGDPSNGGGGGGDEEACPYFNCRAGLLNYLLNTFSKPFTLAVYAVVFLQLVAVLMNAHVSCRRSTPRNSSRAVMADTAETAETADTADTPVPFSNRRGDKDVIDVHRQRDGGVENLYPPAAEVIGANNASTMYVEDL